MGALVAAISLTGLFLWKCHQEPAGKNSVNQSSENGILAAADGGLHERDQGLDIQPNRTVRDQRVPEATLDHIRSNFATLFPNRYADNLEAFLVNQEELINTCLESGEALPLDRFWNSRQQLLGVVPLRHQEEFESYSFFQMDHMQLLLTEQNRAYTWFEKRSSEHWLQYSMEKLESDPFRYPPDIIYAYLTGKELSGSALIERMADIRAQTLMALADHHQRWWLADKTTEGILHIDYELDYHAPGFDEAVKLALDQVGMAQSLQDEEDMIMHRYLNQIRYEAQLANPDIVVR